MLINRYIVSLLSYCYFNEHSCIYFPTNLVYPFTLRVTGINRNYQNALFKSDIQLEWKYVEDVGTLGVRKYTSNLLRHKFHKEWS